MNLLGWSHETADWATKDRFSGYVGIRYSGFEHIGGESPGGQKQLVKAPAACCMPWQ